MPQAHQPQWEVPSGGGGCQCTCTAHQLAHLLSVGCCYSQWYACLHTHLPRIGSLGVRLHVTGQLVHSPSKAAEGKGGPAGLGCHRLQQQRAGRLVAGLLAKMPVRHVIEQDAAPPTCSQQRHGQSPDMGDCHTDNLLPPGSISGCKLLGQRSALAYRINKCLAPLSTCPECPSNPYSTITHQTHSHSKPDPPSTTINTYQHHNLIG